MLRPTWSTCDGPVARWHDRGMNGHDDEVARRILGAPMSLSREQVGREAGVEMARADSFWRALGFPVNDTHEMVFTERDVQALSTVTRLMAEHDIDTELALALTRAVARSSERLATWHTQLLAEQIAEQMQRRGALPASSAGPDAETRAHPAASTVGPVADRVCELVDALEPLLTYAWRRNLHSAVSRMMTDADPESYGLVRQRSVGFADLVNFTALVRRMSERDLGRMVQRFEALSADVITAHGGRLIKSLGDEVMFTTVGTQAAAATALDLVDAMAEDELLPSLRVGMARGPVITRMGDVFGTTVNRAARLTAVAGTNAVLVDALLARELATQSGFELRGQRRRVLQGVGPITPTELRRAAATRTSGSPTAAPPEHTSEPREPTEGQP